MERIGRYEIISELGRGAMGVVYHARDPKIGREVAIKTIKLADQADPSEVEALRGRLFREAQSAGRLSHPGIVTIYDVDEVDGLAFIAMEYVEGRTLAQRMREGAAGALEFQTDLIAQSAAALDYAHSKGIVHRDIKPANLMITAEGAVKIMDFGIARITSSQMTQTGTVLGTPSYMSPEQVKGEEIGGASDQFSLGVIAYELLTGKKPFTGDTLTAVIFQIVTSEPPRTLDLSPWIPPALDAAVRRALAKDQAARFSNCKAFADRFRAGSAAASSPQAGLNFDPEQTVAAAREFETTDSSALAEKTVRGPDGPVLPPLSSKTKHEDSAGAQSLFSAYAETKEPAPDRWKKVFLALAAAVVAVVLALGFTYPWLLDDPALSVAALAGARPEIEVDFSRAEAGVMMRFPPPKPPAVVAKSESEISERHAGAAAEPKPEPPPAKPKAKPQAPAMVAVYFRGNRLGAEVVVDGRAEWTCKTPCRLVLPRGPHVAVARHAGYHPLTRRLRLTGRSEEVIQLELEDARITVIVMSEPSGADIYIDGVKRREKTNAKIPLAPGTYQIRVAKEGIGEAEQVLLVDKEQLPYAKFILR